MLHVPIDLAADWARLPPAARAHLVGFLGARSSGIAVAVDGALPPDFSADLARGGPGLRAAFTQLDRIVVAVDGSSIRIRCRGAHDGLFYGFLRATGRVVEFIEHHALTLHEPISDRVTIDLAAIVRQLGPATSGR